MNAITTEPGVVELSREEGRRMLDGLSEQAADESFGAEVSASLVLTTWRSALKPQLPMYRGTCSPARRRFCC